MKAHEIKPLEERIAKFHALDGRMNEIRWVIEKLTADDPSGPYGEGPFTGNTRESRKIASLQIEFTPTLGGAPAVRMTIDDLFISASSFGEYLEKLLKEQLAAAQKAMDDL